MLNIILAIVTALASFGIPYMGDFLGGAMLMFGILSYGQTAGLYFTLIEANEDAFYVREYVNENLVIALIRVIATIVVYNTSTFGIYISIFILPWIIISVAVSIFAYAVNRDLIKINRE